MYTNKPGCDYNCYRLYVFSLFTREQKVDLGQVPLRA